MTVFHEHLKKTKKNKNIALRLVGVWPSFLLFIYTIFGEGALSPCHRFLIAVLGRHVVLVSHTHWVVVWLRSPQMFNLSLSVHSCIPWR